MNPISLFITIFLFIFVAALPGRTTFVMLIMAARGRPWEIFVGAALAFACQSCISVLLGHLLALFPHRWVQIATGILFLIFAILFWQESRKQISLEKTKGLPQENSSAIRASFFLIFAAEWGDVSQVAIASQAAEHAEQVLVLISAILALWLIAAMAVSVGSRMKKIINPNLIQKIASLVFIVIGIYLIAVAPR